MMIVEWVMFQVGGQDGHGENPHDPATRDGAAATTSAAAAGAVATTKSSQLCTIGTIVANKLIGELGMSLS